MLVGGKLIYRWISGLYSGNGKTQDGYSEEREGVLHIETVCFEMIFEESGFFLCLVNKSNEKITYLIATSLT